MKKKLKDKAEKPSKAAPPPTKVGSCIHGSDPALCQSIYCRAMRAKG